MLDFHQMAAFTVEDLVLINPVRISGLEATAHVILFHEVVHVHQYGVLGLETFMHEYLSSVAAYRNYRTIPPEAVAYEAQDRYVMNPGGLLGGRDGAHHEAMERRIARQHTARRAWDAEPRSSHPCDTAYTAPSTLSPPGPIQRQRRTCMRRWMAVTALMLMAAVPASGLGQTPSGDKMKDDKMKMGQDEKMKNDKMKMDKMEKDKMKKDDNAMDKMDKKDDKMEKK